MVVKKRKALYTPLACQSCRQLLPAYVQMELTNQPADVAYPGIAGHLESCAACALAYGREFDRQGLAQAATALQQVGQRAAPVATVLATHLRQPDPLAALFVPVASKVQRLMATIPIWISDTSFAFGDLTAAFGASVAVALRQLALERGAARQPAQRGQQKEQRGEPQPVEPTLDLLRLPYPERDLLIKVSIGAVTKAQSTLVVQVEPLTQGRPLPPTRVILADQQGEPLEMRPLDADGLITFSQLPLSTYTLQIIHEGQAIELAVALLSHS